MKSKLPYVTKNSVLSYNWILKGHMMGYGMRG
jgi:hypothetical protein